MSFPSTTNLWATASKNWVIPAKRKPGRKPKKDVPPRVIKDEEVDSESRRVQNRAAQRAFRERKQSQLADLQARLQSFEQGEIERNVAIQNIAKRLKEENEQLRKENALLKEKLRSLEQRPDSCTETDRKRSRIDSPSISSSFNSDNSSRKKTKLTIETSSVSEKSLGISQSHLPSPPSMVSSPDSNENSDVQFSEIPFTTMPPDPPVFPSDTSTMENILGFSQNVKAANFDSSHFPSLDCGFCNEHMPCVCREIALQQVASEQIEMHNQTKMEAFEQKTPAIRTNESTRVSPPTTSILHNLPAYQPPIPLRRRTTSSSLKSIFPVLAKPPQPVHGKSSVTCSGDPNNCRACVDDSFGKAFCAAIGESVANSRRCNGCPGGDCCGDTCNCAHVDHLPTLLEESSTSDRTSTSETIPTNDAWLKLKSHPNVTFADLSLLADVVARRSKCTGPRVVISPALGSCTPERSTSSDPHPQLSQGREPDNQYIALTDPHSRFRTNRMERVSRLSPPLQLVPQEVLIRCGRRSVREVHADAVSDALRLLDAKSARP